MGIFKVASGWTGTSGGPGLTQLYFEVPGGADPSQSQAQSAVNAVRAFWDEIKAVLPNEIVVTVSPQVDVFDPLDGQLIDSVLAAVAPAGVVGTDAGNYSMASGVKATLQTNEIRNGRRVRGSIYIVPAGASTMTAFGTVAAATRTTINTAGNGIISDLTAPGVNWIVWGRPVKDAQGNLTRNGSVNFVQGVDTSEKGCILRGRRD